MSVERGFRCREGGGNISREATIGCGVGCHVAASAALRYSRLRRVTLHASSNRAGIRSPSCAWRSPDERVRERGRGRGRGRGSARARGRARARARVRTRERERERERVRERASERERERDRERERQARLWMATRDCWLYHRQTRAGLVARHSRARPWTQGTAVRWFISISLICLCLPRSPTLMNRAGWLVCTWRVSRRGHVSCSSRANLV